VIVKFENKYNMTKEQINIPFLIEENPIGMITNVTKSEITVNIFDKFIGFEVKNKMNSQIIAMYLSNKEQRSYQEVMDDIKYNSNKIK
jgi:hypothetical protein